VDKEKSRVLGIAKGFILLIEPKKELFIRLEKDYKNIKEDIKE
jgi:hypothetical protein